MARAPKVLLTLVGVLNILAALFGLLYNTATAFGAYRIEMTDLIRRLELVHFYPVFWTMSAVCVTCYGLLLMCGMALLGGRVRWTPVFAALCVFEVGYFLSLRWLAELPIIGMSVEAAAGVANGGLMAQFFIALPVWGPVAAYWAKRRLEQSTAMGHR